MGRICPILNHFTALDDPRHPKGLVSALTGRGGGFLQGSVRIWLLPCAVRARFFRSFVCCWYPSFTRRESDRYPNALPPYFPTLICPMVSGASKSFRFPAGTSCTRRMPTNYLLRRLTQSFSPRQRRWRW